jgi:hypothetical protein
MTPSLVSSVAVRLYFSGVQLSGKPLQFAANCHVSDCLKDSAGRYSILVYPASAASSHVIVRASVPAATTPGQYTLSVLTTASGLSKTTNIPLRVQAWPAPLPQIPSLSGGPIPNLAKWQLAMTNYGKKWCDPTFKYSWGSESQVWFYDGARVFFQIADFTKDPSWEACGFNIARQYRDYVIAQNGQISNWRIFTQGLRMAYERTADPSFRTAIKLLAAEGYVRWQTSVDDRLIRETAFALSSVIDAEKTGEPRSPHLARLSDYLLAHYDRLFVAKTYSIHQTFYDGLAAEALIEYYELTGDARIPPAIRMMLDWMWDFGWDKTRHTLVYNPDPLGPTCSTGCQVYHTGLNNLIVPAFAWYWRLTGDPAYQKRGDELFAHSLDEDISYNGKIFSQNYRWSFDFVKWRQDTCSYDVSWPTNPIASGGGTVPVQVVTQPQCSWTAQTSASWSSVTAGPITGTGTATVKASANTTADSRSTTVTIAGQTGSVNQDASPLRVPALTFPPSVPGGSIVTGTVSLNPAAVVAATVYLTSSSPAVAAVPASVVIPAGSTSVSFFVKTTAVSAATIVNITATYGTSSKTASLTVQLADTSGSKLASFWMYPGYAKGGVTTTNNRVTLDKPAGLNGAVVMLTSTNPAIAAVPRQVIVPAGQLYTSFAVVTTSVLVTTTASVTASHGSVSKTATLTVHPIAILQVQLSPATVIGGKSALYNRIKFDGPVPPEGAVVTLASSHPALASLPTSIIAPGTGGGVYSSHFVITTTRVTTITPVTISASYRGVTVKTTLTLNPAQ